MMVAYFHLRAQVPEFARDLSFHWIVDSDRLSSGVSIFFVISGFIMYVTGRKLTAANFIRRRIARILPLYWSITLAVCAVAIAAPHAVRRTDVTLEYLAKSLFFIPYHNPTQLGLLFPILVPGWSLNYEIAFYALFSVALLAPPRWRTSIIGGALGTCALAGSLRPRPELLDIWGFYTSSQLLLFAAGIALGALYTQLQARAAEGVRPQLPRWACAGLALIGFWMILGDWPGQVMGLTGSVAIVTGIVAWEHQYGLPRWRGLLLLGDASYSLYLVHLVAFGITRALWGHLGAHGALGAAGFAATSMVAAVSLALVTYRFIELPALAMLTAGRQTPGVQQSACDRPRPRADLGEVQ